MILAATKYAKPFDVHTVVQSVFATAQSTLRSLAMSRRLSQASKRHAKPVMNFLDVALDCVKHPDMQQLSLVGFCGQASMEEFALVFSALVRHPSLRTVDLRGDPDVDDGKAAIVLHLLPFNPHMAVLLDSSNPNVSATLLAAVTEQCIENGVARLQLLEEQDAAEARMRRRRAKDAAWEISTGLLHEEGAARTASFDEEVKARRKLMAQEHMALGATRRRVQKRAILDMDTEARHAVEGHEVRDRHDVEGREGAARLVALVAYEETQRTVWCLYEAVAADGCTLARREHFLATRAAEGDRRNARKVQRVELAKEETDKRKSLMALEHQFRAMLRSDEADLRDFIGKAVQHRVERENGELRRRKVDRERVEKDRAQRRERERTEEVKRQSERAREKERLQSRSHVIMNQCEREEKVQFELLRQLSATLHPIAKLKADVHKANERVCSTVLSLAPGASVSLPAQALSVVVARHHRPVACKAGFDWRFDQAKLQALETQVADTRQKQTLLAKNLLKTRDALIHDAGDDVLAIVQMHQLDRLLFDFDVDRCPLSAKCLAERCRIRESVITLETALIPPTLTVPAHVTLTVQSRNAADWHADVSTIRPGVLPRVTYRRVFPCNLDDFHSFESPAEYNAQLGRLVHGVLSDISVSAAMLEDSAANRDLHPEVDLYFQAFDLQLRIQVTTRVGRCGPGAVTARGTFASAWPFTEEDNETFTFEAVHPVHVSPPTVSWIFEREDGVVGRERPRVVLDDSMPFVPLCRGVGVAGGNDGAALSLLCGVTSFNGFTIDIRIVDPSPTDTLLFNLCPSYVRRWRLAGSASDDHVVRVLGCDILVDGSLPCICPFQPLPDWVVHDAHVHHLHVQLGPSSSAREPLSPRIPTATLVTAAVVRATLQCVGFVDGVSRCTSQRTVDVTLTPPSHLVGWHEGLSSTCRWNVGIDATMPQYAACQRRLRVCRPLPHVRPLFALAGADYLPLAGLLIRPDIPRCLVRLFPGAQLRAVGSADRVELPLAKPMTPREKSSSPTDDELTVESSEAVVALPAACVAEVLGFIEVSIHEPRAGEVIGLDVDALRIATAGHHLRAIFAGDTRLPCDGFGTPTARISIVSPGVPTATLEDILGAVSFASTDFRCSSAPGAGLSEARHTATVAVKLRLGDFLFDEDVVVHFLPALIDLPLSSQRIRFREGRKPVSFGPFVHSFEAAASTLKRAGNVAATDCISGGSVSCEILQGSLLEDALTIRNDADVGGFHLRRISTKTSKRVTFTEDAPRVDAEEADAPLAISAVPTAASGTCPPVPPQSTGTFGASSPKKRMPMPHRAPTIPWAQLRSAVTADTGDGLTALSDRWSAARNPFLDHTAPSVVVDPGEPFGGELQSSPSMLPFRGAAVSTSALSVVERARCVVKAFVASRRAEAASKELTPNDGVLEAVFDVLSNEDGGKVGEAVVTQHTVRVSFDPPSTAAPYVDIGRALHLLAHVAFASQARQIAGGSTFSDSAVTGGSMRQAAAQPVKFVRCVVQPFDGSASQCVGVIDVQRDDAAPVVRVAFPKLRYHPSQAHMLAIGAFPVAPVHTCFIGDYAHTAAEATSYFDGGALTVEITSRCEGDVIYFMSKEEQGRQRVLFDVWRQEQRFLVQNGYPVDPNVTDLLVSSAALSSYENLVDVAGSTRTLMKIGPNGMSLPKPKKGDDDRNVIGVVDAGDFKIHVSFSGRDVSSAVATSVLSAIAFRPTAKRGKRVITVRIKRGQGNRREARCRLLVDVQPSLVAPPSSLTLPVSVKRVADRSGLPVRLFATVDFTINLRKGMDALRKGYVDVRIVPTAEQDTAAPPKAPNGKPVVHGEALCLLQPSAVDGSGSQLRQVGRQLYLSGAYVAALSVLSHTHLRLAFDWCSQVDAAAVNVLLRCLAYVWTQPTGLPSNQLQERTQRHVEVSLSDGDGPPFPTLMYVAVCVEPEGTRR